MINKQVSLCCFELSLQACRSQMCSANYSLLFTCTLLYINTYRLLLKILRDQNKYRITIYIYICVCQCNFNVGIQVFKISTFPPVSIKPITTVLVPLTCYILDPALSCLFDHPKNIVSR